MGGQSLILYENEDACEIGGDFLAIAVSIKEKMCTAQNPVSILLIG